MSASLFEQAWRRLVGAFGRYNDVPRDPDNLDPLAKARIDLEDARQEIDQARPAKRAKSSSKPAPSSLSRVDISSDDVARIQFQGRNTRGEG